MGAREQFKSFDVAEYLDTPGARASYLKAMWEDSDGDPVTVATALGDVARAMGMSQIARDTGVAREALYKALSPQGNPELATIMRVLGAIGLELSVRPRKAGPKGGPGPSAPRVSRKQAASSRTRKSTGQRRGGGAQLAGGVGPRTAATALRARPSR